MSQKQAKKQKLEIIKTNSVKKAKLNKLKANQNSFANISFIFREPRKAELEENEFQFLLATAIQSLHGEFANRADLLAFTAIDNQNYTAIIRFRTEHYTRVITSLLLFGEWKEADCKFEVTKVAQTPCFLTI